VTQRNDDLIRLLNQALGLEYGALWLLPQHMAQIEDEELRRQLHLIADMELDHAEKSAQMIYRLGGKPDADLPQLKVRHGLREILESHVEGERAAIAVYSRGVEMADDPDIRNMLEELKRDEEGHQRLLERALARL
jgi:rubrerythrin